MRVGPFKIKKIKGLVNYELELLPDAKVHPIFHILLLEQAADNILLATQFMFEPQEDNVYEVEEILQKQGNQYLIK